MDEVLKRLEKLERLIESQGVNAKEVLNFHEAAQFLELSHSHLYKLTSAGSIPHYKPNGKKIYFRRDELESWLLRNKVTTSDEIEQQAADYIIKKGRVAL
jgi:excisionase family DNA binding protein